MLLEDDLDNEIGDNSEDRREPLAPGGFGQVVAPSPRSKAMAEQDCDLFVDLSDFGDIGTMSEFNLATEVNFLLDFPAGSASLSATQWKSTLPEASKALALAKIDCRGRNAPAGNFEHKDRELSIKRCTPFSLPNFSGNFGVVKGSCSSLS
eukprot:CAMPEP_0204007138 /NCGR_PEP_ID=MMETSP0360-20130528/20263_1 /ASSEMBLY_ACC=CAM_ASM_000342 /TAXON_ID=268821 /ORGANISM="Scrippsiella Hangoei, Strain SHTV-5" /LENGTH=150 /DNA_ID=CAMNT_0050949315 /DNA_START=255 /DNA_END=704 /DNA_ORIENTATION=+